MKIAPRGSLVFLDSTMFPAPDGTQKSPSYRGGGDGTARQRHGVGGSKATWVRLKVHLPQHFGQEIIIFFLIL